MSNVIDMDASDKLESSEVNERIESLHENGGEESQDTGVKFEISVSKIKKDRQPRGVLAE